MRQLAANAARSGSAWSAGDTPEGAFTMASDGGPTAEGDDSRDVLGARPWVRNRAASSLGSLCRRRRAAIAAMSPMVTILGCSSSRSSTMPARPRGRVRVRVTGDHPVAELDTYNLNCTASFCTPL